MAKREGIWFVAEFDGHRGVIAKSNLKELNGTTRNELLSAKHKVEVLLAYDFLTPLRPMPILDGQGRPVPGPDGRPMMGIAREYVPTGNSFMLEPCRTYVNMALVTKMTFVDDMSPFDQKRCEEFIEQVTGHLEQQRKAMSPLHFVDNPKDAKLPVGPEGVIDLSKLRT